MADTKISDLTVETAPPAASDYFVAAQEDITNTAVPASMLTLFHSAVSADTNQTMVAGTLYKVTMAAWASDNDFTLPVAASVSTGDRVGIYIVDGDADYELDIKTGAAGDLIQGTDHSSTAWSRLFRGGELVIFQCIDGATADWLVEYDGRISQKTRLYLNVTDSNGAVNSTWSNVDFDSETYDDGDLRQSGSPDYLAPRRAGTYQCIAQTRTTVADATLSKTAVYNLDATQLIPAPAITRGATASSDSALVGTLMISASDVGTNTGEFKIMIFQNSGSDRDITAGTTNTFFELLEVF